MNEDIKNRKLSKLQFHALEDQLLSNGGGIAGAKDNNGLYQLDPQNMSINDMEAARNFLMNQDATSNLLGQARLQAGVDPVQAQQASENIPNMSFAPTVEGNALDALREQNGFPASLQNRNIINRFQKPTKEEKKAIKKVASEKDKAVRTPAGEEQTMEAMQAPSSDYNSQELLANALGTQNENNLINSLLRGTGQVNAGLNLIKPDTSGVEALEKTAGQPVTNYEKIQKGVENDLHLTKIKSELNNEKSLNDPNSAISKLARETMASIGVNMPENVSAGVLKQSGVNVGTLLGIKEGIEGKKELATIYSGQKKEADKEKADQKSHLSDKQTQAITDIDKAISHIKDIILQKPSISTGPKADLRNKIAHVGGVDDATISGFRSAVGEQLASYIKSISGAAVSEPEARRLLANMPTMYDNDETFTVKAQRVLESLEKDKEIYLANLNKQGKNVAEYGKQAARQPASEEQNKHKDDKKAVQWAKENLSKPENAQDALDILKANGIL